MQGSCVEVLLQRFHLRGLGPAAVNAAIEQGGQRLAQLNRGREYPVRLLLSTRPPQSSSLSGGQQPQLRCQTQKISIGRQEVRSLCGKSHVQSIDELQRRVSGKQF